MNRFGFTDTEWQEILAILKNYAEIEKVVLFGSRAKNTFKSFSDVDIVLFGKNLTYQTITALQSNFEDSNLPYTFDILDYKNISSEELKQHIKTHGKTILNGENNTLKGWVETTLNKAVSKIIDYRGKTPKKLGENWSINGRYRALSAKSVKTGGLVNLEQINRVDETLYKKWMKDEIQFNDILLTSEAPMGEVLHWKSKEKIVLSQRLFALRTKETISPNYLYYYFISKRFQFELKARASGTTVLGIRQAELIKTKVILPPTIEEQKSIAKILTAFDDKIENLQAQNKTLETTAQTIFKQWFGKYKIDDVLPDGWRECKLGEITNISAGGDKPKNSTNSKTVNNKIPIYSNGVTNNGLYGFTDIPKIIKESVTVSARGTIGFVCLRFNPYLPIVRLISIIPIQKYLSSKYLFFYLKNQNISGFGTTQQQLTIPVFKKTKIIIPSSELMNEFTKKVDSFYNKIQNNNSQIQTLQKTRDTLLPKLMSGSLRVDEFTENVV